MDKTPEHCLPSMGTQLLVGGLNFDGLSPCVELDYWGHRLVSRDRVVFTLDLFHSQQLPNGGHFSTALFRLRHSFSSYNLVAEENEARLQMELGHTTPKMLIEHYRAI